jgi:hypothetical protein
MESRGRTATVVALSEHRDIYMVIDERSQPLGTGTKEVCDFLAALIMRPYAPLRFERFQFAQRATTANIRSAIQI